MNISDLSLMTRVEVGMMDSCCIFALLAYFGSVISISYRKLEKSTIHSSSSNSLWYVSFVLYVQS